MSPRGLPAWRGRHLAGIWLAWLTVGAALAGWQRTINFEALRNPNGYIVLSLFTTVTWTACGLFLIPPALLTLAWLVTRGRADAR